MTRLQLILVCLLPAVLVALFPWLVTEKHTPSSTVAPGALAVAALRHRTEVECALKLRRIDKLAAAADEPDEC